MNDYLYRTPILTRIFHVLGWINVVSAVVAFIVLIADNGPHNHMVGPALVALLVGLTTAAILFGSGQVIEFIGEIAYNSGRLVTAAERVDSRTKDNGATLEKIAAISKRATALAAPAAAAPPHAGTRPYPPPSATTASPNALRRYFYIDLDSQVAGPVSEAKLRQLFEAATVGDETQICAEGENDWKPLTEAVLL